MEVEWFIERLQELGLSTEAIALAQGMLLGDKSVLDPGLIQQFRTAGMSHLLAVSGLHVGVIMSLVWMLLRPLEVLVFLLAPPRPIVCYVVGITKRLIVIALTICYVDFIGAPPSAVRAALMLSLCLIGWMLRRPTSTWHCLFLSALILLASDPYNLVQIGFQLSFLAVAGILLFQPWLNDRSQPWWWRLLLLSISAQWLTAPLIAYYFHQVPCLGWLQGLLVVPLVPCFVACLLLGFCFPSMHWLALPIEAFGSWLSCVADMVDKGEHLLLGGHLYLYPSWLEALLTELLLASILVVLNVLYTKKAKARAVDAS